MTEIPCKFRLGGMDGPLSDTFGWAPSWPRDLLRIKRRRLSIADATPLPPPSFQLVVSKKRPCVVGIAHADGKDSTLDESCERDSRALAESGPPSVQHACEGM